MPKIVDREDKRTQLVIAATKVFARDGLSATKMADVAGEAGVGKGTIYEYFTSKKELFWAVCESLVTWPDAIDAYTSEPVDGLQRLIRDLLSSYESSSDFFLILLDYWAELLRDKDGTKSRARERAEKIYTQPRSLLVAVVDAGKARNLFRDDLDSSVVASLIIAGVEGLRIQQMQDPSHVDLESSVETLSAMIVGQLTAR